MDQTIYFHDQEKKTVSVAHLSGTSATRSAPVTITGYVTVIDAKKPAENRSRTWSPNPGRFANRGDTVSDGLRMYVGHLYRQGLTGERCDEATYDKFAALYREGKTQPVT